MINTLTPSATRFYDKSDLIYQYRWNAKDASTGSLQSDKVLVDITQGVQVLNIINAFANSRSFSNKYSGIKIEKMLNIYLPSDVDTQAKIMAWIEERWFDFM